MGYNYVVVRLMPRSSAGASKATLSLGVVKTALSLVSFQTRFCQPQISGLSPPYREVYKVRLSALKRSFFLFSFPL